MKKKRLLYFICALSMVISTPLCEAGPAHATVRRSATRKKLLPKVLLPALAVIALAAAAGVGWRRSRRAVPPAGQSPDPSVVQTPSPGGTASLSPLELAQNTRPESSISASSRRQDIVASGEPVSLRQGHNQWAALDLVSEPAQVAIAPGSLAPSGALQCLLASDAAERSAVNFKKQKDDRLASLQKLSGFGKVTISDVANLNLALSMIPSGQVVFLSELTQDALPPAFLPLMQSPLPLDVAEAIVSFVRGLGSEHNLKPLRLLCLTIPEGLIYCLVCRDSKLLFFLPSSSPRHGAVFLGGGDIFRDLQRSLCRTHLLSIYPWQALSDTPA